MLSDEAFTSAGLQATEEAVSANASRQTWICALSLDVTMQEIMHTLRNIGCEHEAELDRDEKSAIAVEFKPDISEKLRTAHRERRHPYADLLKGSGCSSAASPSWPDLDRGRLGLCESGRSRCCGGLAIGA
jgi:hypothetical protein